MGKYLMTWEMDPSKIPISREERAAAWRPLVDMVKQGMKEGKIKDWGIFVGENRGYSVAEGSEIEINANNQNWVPFVEFTVHQVASIDDVASVLEIMSK